MNENVVQFFHKMRLAQQVHQRDNVLDAILRRIVALFGMSRAEACQVLTDMVKNDLYIYFDDEKFEMMTDAARKSWLRNLLLSSPKGLSKMQESVHRLFPHRDTSVDEAWMMAYNHYPAVKAPKAPSRQSTVQPPSAPPPPPKPQRSHPLSPHEWTDPVTQVRYYDDPSEGCVALPFNAPPRPSSLAYWHLLRKAWYVGDQPVDTQGNPMIII